MASREFDVVLYGASGFTGRQTIQYFHENAPKSLNWAVAGRNRAKLEKVAEEYAPGRRLSIIPAEGSERSKLDQMCGRTRVVLTTAGPFSLYGRDLVAACVEAGTHYVDITGETTFVADLIESHHERAAADGTRIIPFSGFDSIPSDLGVWVAAQHFKKDGAGLGRVMGAFKVRGGLNGGTMATALAMARDGRQKDMADVFLLNPPGSFTDEERGRNADLRTSLKHPQLGWLTPFVMASINTRVVRRSQALLAQRGESYGRDFSYQEGLQAKGRFGAAGIALGLGMTEGLLRTRLGRGFLGAVTPNPGQGPSQETMDTGFFSCRFHVKSDHGRHALITLYSAGDPGNRVTVTALCESALCLALDGADLPGGPDYGGILTPASGLGNVLLNRLKAAGWTVTIEDLEPQ